MCPVSNNLSSRYAGRIRAGTHVKTPFARRSQRLVAPWPPGLPGLAPPVVPRSRLSPGTRKPSGNAAFGLKPYRRHTGKNSAAYGAARHQTNLFLAKTDQFCTATNQFSIKTNQSCGKTNQSCGKTNLFSGNFNRKSGLAGHQQAHFKLKPIACCCWALGKKCFNALCGLLGLLVGLKHGLLSFLAGLMALYADWVLAPGACFAFIPLRISFKPMRVLAFGGHLRGKRFSLSRVAPFRGAEGGCNRFVGIGLSLAWRRCRGLFCACR